MKIAKKNDVTINYEAAIAGGIPVVKAIRENLKYNNISKVYGILNGTKSIEDVIKETKFENLNLISSNVDLSGLEVETAGDNDRAFIIGETSFGKGLVQNQFPLGSKDAIRLTVAKYYTPSGRSIQKPFESYKDNIDYLIKDSKKPRDQAIDTIMYYSTNGKKLFTKGGILPDKILPSKEAKSKNIISYEIIWNQFNRMVIEEVDKNRNFYSKLKREDVLKEEFLDKAKWIELLNVLSKKNKIDLKSSDYEIMFNSIRSILVFQLFDRKTQIEVNNSNDPYIFEAIKILK